MVGAWNTLIIVLHDLTYVIYEQPEFVYCRKLWRVKLDFQFGTGSAAHNTF